MPDAPMPESPRSSSSGRREWLGWLLAPLLAIAAIGLHFALDVPRHPMIQRSKDKPETKRKTAARTPRKWQPRSKAYTRRLREAWSDRPLKEEPKDRRFRAHHEPLLRAVVRKAEAAFVPAHIPVQVQVRPVCHTIRCSLEICAAPEIVDGVAEHMPRFEVGRRSLWHELREVEPKRARDDRACRRWIVGFEVEGADPRKLHLRS